MTVKKALLAATMLALPLVAQAQPVSGLYVGAGAGANWRTDESGTIASGTVNQRTGVNTPLINGSSKTVTRIGAVGLGSIGWGFGNGLRAEVEGNYRQNEIKKTSVNGTRIAGSQGYLDTYGAMFNVLYDFNLGLPFVPYVGAGVGYGWNEINQAGPLFPRDKTEGRLAYQGIVGAAYQLYDMVPGLALTLEGRYYGTVNPSFHEQTGINPTTSLQSSFKPNSGNASLLLGVRYAFNAAPLPVLAPVVAAPPAVARTYLVFFDWDKYNLTDRAKQIIAEAASASRSTGTTKIDVAGHADRSGTPAYNQRLSQRRADAVAAELVQRGVAKSDIIVTAFGESRPLVPTADGVREPQNRRVEIVLK